MHSALFAYCGTLLFTLFLNVLVFHSVEPLKNNNGLFDRTLLNVYYRPMMFKIFCNQQNILLLICSAIFFSHLVFIVVNTFCPNETFTRFEEKKLDKIDFPVNFRICIFPSLKEKSLNLLGYENVWKYFLGESIHNDSIYGWAGHQKESQKQENYSVIGKIFKKTNMFFILKHICRF